MTIDYSNIDVDAILDDAAVKTDAKLAGQISSVTQMSDEEIVKLFPAKEDAEKLLELMEIVNSAESRNSKINNIAANSEKFAGIVLTLVGKFV